LRAIDKDSLAELKSIYDETGATEMGEKIEKFSIQKAEQLGYDTDDESGMDKYFLDIYKGKI